MISALSRTFDRFRGSGEAAVTIPSMDGALRPNVQLENAPLLHRIEAPDNLVPYGGKVLFSSRDRLMEINLGGSEPVIRERMSSEVTFLTSHGPDTLAIGLAEGRIVIRGGSHDGKAIADLGGRSLVAATAAVFDGADTLFVCLGSQYCALSEWKRDLMSKNASGSVWRVELATLAATCLADGLAFPYGIALNARGELVVSESWRQRVILLQPQRAPRTLYGDIPGYPSRVVRDGVDLWLAVFAPRTQLIEFVLREDEYRKQMMTEIDPEYWIAPSMHHPRSFLEPLQGGGLKQLGELKPWAPSRSYGLVVRLDGDCLPVESFHSRANGTRHGVTSCLPQRERVIIASKGGDAIISVER